MAPAFGQESRMLGIFIPGPDLSKSGADAWAKSQLDPIEKARRKARKIEKSLTSVGKRPSDFDTRRFVRKVATAASVLEHKPVIGRTFLSDDDIPQFLQRKVNCSLTAAQVGALLDKVPEYSDPNKTSDWLLEHQPESRVVDAVFAVNLITSLGEAHNGVQTANRIRADLKDAALEAKVHKAARPKSAPNRVRPPVVGQCTTAFMRLLDSPSKKKTEPTISFGVAAKLLTKMKKTRPKSARGWGSRDARPSAYARDIAGWSIKAVKRPKSALPKRSAHARLNNLVAGAHIIDLGGPRRRTELPPAPLPSPVRMRDLPQKPLEAHDAGIAKLQAIALRHERHAIDRLDGCDIQDLASFVEKRFHVHLTKAEASAIQGLARDGVALQATLRELATIGCRRSPRVLLSGLLAAVPLAPGANESLVALGGDLAAKASQGSGHAQDRLEKLERACAWAARRIELYPDDESIAFGLKRLQKLVRAELERRHVTKKKVKTLRHTVSNKPADKPKLVRRESNLTKLKNQLNDAHERQAQQQVLSKFTENHRVREHQVFKDVQARSHRARATMNAAEFASMIHRDLASQAASAFAVAKSPVSQKDEDELHEERLHRMTRAGSPCSSGDEGSPQASPVKPVQKVTEVKAPSNPTTPRRRPSRRTSLPTTPSQRGPFGAVATQLAAEVINNCVRSFVYRCLRKKMARAQHEWKRWMEQRAHRMLARAARTWAAKARMRKRYLRVQAQLFDQSRSIIERLILRKVRKMRALKAGLTGAAYAMAVGSIFDKDPLSEEEAAVRLQKRFRAIDARARSMTLQHAREATRCIRVEVVKARGLRVADARRLNQADHHTFIGGAADPRCYVSAQLGNRGGFGPSNAGAPEEAKERIERQYDILLKRHQALDEQHVRDDGVEKRKYLDALDKLKESSEEKNREAIASRAANLSSVMDKACLLKMRRNTMPFWMPSIVRARDWGKFAAYPSRYPLFRAKTKVIQKTLDPTWNAQFDVHGVDPDSTVTFTVADVDDPTSPQSADDRDDFLGQVTVQLNALRHADFLAQMTYEAERRAKLKAKAGRRPSKTKTRLQADGALLVMDARARLGPNLVPVSKVVNEKVNHVAFDDVHVEATGAVYYRIWAAPRARSICGHLEVKVQRGFVVSFWKPVWACLAFNRLTLRDHRGDEHLRLDLPLRHLEAVEVHSPETAESIGDTFSLVLGGGKRHDLRVGDLGTPLRDVEHQAWVRRLRRCAPRIPTNEFADSACPFLEYTETRKNDGGVAARRASMQRRAVAPGKGVDPLAGLGDFLAMNG